MCDRYELPNPTSIREHYALPQKTTFALKGWPGKNNVKPSNYMPIVIARDGRSDALGMVWGLKVQWKASGIIINARAETIAERPMFHHSFREKRCLIPANGFYEWLPGDKKPYYFYLPDAQLFSFAGIYQQSEDNIERYAIITTRPNGLVKPIRVSIHKKEFRTLSKSEAFQSHAFAVRDAAISHSLTDAAWTLHDP